ncbi:hypothetical protein Rhe02_10140 [Rhizocola hellebori]|uniref:Amino acid adenylation domain-containing protein n=1 Tax=Rhizocola hellebori TaxID=1392758 RepID=A0A8J3Q408_9ACTN|nr:non-ribosomal peptide synthetase/MFS transporter [Rhizocola hellebori]GIH02947.1 hypothetical protein Rhe02_10140 [Rhizocola hellebori]
MTLLDREARVKALLTSRLAKAGEAIPGRPDPACPARLSAAQRAMWLSWQIDPGSPAYNVPVGLRLSGELAVPALGAAVHDVVARHEVLRSVITGEGTLAVLAGAPVSLIIDPAEPVAQVAWQPFDLASQPPMRAHLWRTGVAEHLLLFTFHHIAMDAWSIGLFLDELATAYTSRAGGAVAQLAPAPQYADYVAWRGPSRAEPDLLWWRERLAGLPTAVDLPGDRVRDKAAGWSAVQVPLEFPADLTGRVRDYASANGSTTFMVLLGAAQALLGKLSGSTDIAIGVPEAGRHHAGTEKMLGSFVNTLVVRAEVPPEATVGELFERTRQGALDAFAHGGAHFAEVLEAVAPERIPGVTPLFQVLFNVHDSVAVPRFPGLRAALEEPETPVAKFDLSFNVADHGAEGLRGVLVAREALFGPATARQIARWYRNVLDGMLARPGVPLADIALAPVSGPLLSGPRRAVATEPLHVLVERQADLVPQRVAVVAADGQLTYAELDRAANRLAHRLGAAGLGPGDTIGVLAERRTSLIVALLGVLKAGCAYVPLDPAYPSERIAAMLSVASAAALVTEAAELFGACPVVQIDGPGPEHRPEVAVSGADLVYVIFTSGSTGAPKGVQVEHGQLVGYLHHALERLGEPAAGGRSFALVSTIAADLGLTNVFGALLTGGTLHLIDREVAADPVALTRYVEQNPIDVLKCVPSHLQMLAAHGNLAALLPRRLLIVAGEPCPWDLVARVRAVRPELAIQNSYGPTETTVAVFMYEVADGDADAGSLPLGTPLPNVDCYVVDGAGRPLPAGVPGELWLGGPSVARGYAGRDDLTAARFVPDPVHGNVRCYRTGDRVSIGRDGSVRFLGRGDDQVKVRGFRVELQEVVAALRACPGVADAAVLPAGVAHQRRLVAWVSPESVDTAAVRAALRRRLPDYMVPSSLIAMPNLPMNPNGKLDRAALQASQTEAEQGRGGPPSTPGELLVAQVWQRLLGVTDIGADDDFFALGGDSFQAVRAVREIDPGLRVVDLFTSPTVRELAAMLDGSGSGGHLLHRLGGSRDAELTVVCIPYGGGSAAAYRPLAQALGDRVCTLAAELPGHDPARPDEALLPLENLVSLLADEIVSAKPGPLIVYGHCVGTATAVALAAELESREVTLDCVVLGGAFPAARLPGRVSALVSRILPTDRRISDRTYRDILRLLGGMEDLDDAEANQMMHSLRHDARQAEAWFTARLADGQGRLRAPILCVVGERDRGTELYRERFLEWGAFSDRLQLATIARAGHYFVKHQADQLAAIIERRGPFHTVAQDAAAVQRGLRAFYTVAFGQTISLIGSAIGSFALGVWAYQRQGAMFDYALVTMLALLPTIALLPLGGAVADRFDRRRIMIACDGVSALAMLALSIALALDRLDLWLVALIAGLGSAVTAFHRPAYLAAVGQLVPKPFLTQANALAQLGTGVGLFLAPMAGGVLVVSFGLPFVIGLDVASFSIGLLTLLLVRFPDKLFRRRDETFARAVAGGWRYLMRRRPLKIMIVYFTVVNYLFMLALVVSTPMVLAFDSATGLGVVTAASGLGAALGSAVMVAWGGTRRRALGMVGFVIGMGVGVAVMGLRPSIPVIAVGAALWYASLSMVNAHWIAMIQLKVGLELQGRVLAMNQMMAVAMTPLAFVTAPYLAEAFTPLLAANGPLADSAGAVLGEGAGRGMGLLLVICGAALAVIGAAGLRYRPLSRMEDDLPNAVTGAEIADDLDEVQAEADRSLTPTSTTRLVKST